MITLDLDASDNNFLVFSISFEGVLRDSAGSWLGTVRKDHSLEISSRICLSTWKPNTSSSMTLHPAHPKNDSIIAQLSLQLSFPS